MASPSWSQSQRRQLSSHTRGHTRPSAPGKGSRSWIRAIARRSAARDLVDEARDVEAGRAARRAGGAALPRVVGDEQLESGAARARMSSLAVVDERLP